MPHNYTTDFISRFFSNIKAVPSGCHEWQRSKKPGGYGQLRLGGKTLYAHRVAWEIANGDIPNGLHVCHTCDNPKCVNPDHLFLGTHADNMRDKKMKGRAVAFNGESHPRSRLTENVVREIRRMRTNGLTLRAIASEFGVSHVQVFKVCGGKQWKCVE